MYCVFTALLKFVHNLPPFVINQKEYGVTKPQHKPYRFVSDESKKQQMKVSAMKSNSNLHRVNHYRP